MKKHIITILIINIIMFIPIKINASYDAIITGDTVRIRTGAGTNYKDIVTVNSGTEITVIDKTLYTGDGCSDKWYKITYDNKTGYVCSKYVSFTNTSYSGINVIDYTARVNANNVAVRKGTSTSYDAKDTLSLGVNVTIQSTHNGSKTGCSSGKWYNIKYYSNSQGYICSNYVTKKEDITKTDNEYEKTLKEAGFPETYWPYLSYLHEKYPNWIFNASKTNIDFTKAINSETGKCYMQTTNDNYRSSSSPAEGSSWFHINKGVIAFYMDPRNWLTKERIFMFEKQDYAKELESNYSTLVKAVFGSGKLSDDKYTNPMVNAGKTNKISPILIASRIRLEVGANGSDSTNGTEFTWKGKKYSGYYNFFNIGAYETTINGVKYSAITRGLAYAAKLIKRDGELWNNIETAITEGSSFLANGYVTKGQGTLYYQKFNTGPNAYYDSFTHQYQTNVQAPATEGNIAYNSYKDSDVLNLPFIFEIPIYNNMPDYTSLPNSGNTNNDLESLQIENYNLSPDFDEDILTYTSYVPLKTEKIKINAKTKVQTSSISGIGEVELPTNENQITITVTSEAGEEKKYTITVYKVENTATVDSVLKEVKGSVSGTYITKIKNGTTANDYKNSLIKAGAHKVTLTNANGKTITGSSLITTNSKITISTLNDSKTFTLVVKGDTSADGKITILDLLQVQKHIKKSSVLSGAKALAADTSEDGKITILDLLQLQKHIKGDKKL